MNRCLLQLLRDLFELRLQRRLLCAADLLCGNETRGKRRHHSSPMEALKNLSKRHKAFVKRVHSFRLPLGPMGQRVAGCV